MATLKLLAVAVPIVGGGIGAPVYFLTANSKSSASTRLTEFFSKVSNSKSDKPEDFKKVTCQSSDVSSGASLETFLKTQKKDISFYSYLICHDAGAHREDNSLVGAQWEGLFPKKVLNDIFSPIGREGTFEMNMKSSMERDTLTTFSHPTKSSSLKVRWVDLLDEANFSTQTVILTSIEGDGYELRDVYLLLFQKKDQKS